MSERDTLFDTREIDLPRNPVRDIGQERDEGGSTVVFITEQLGSWAKLTRSTREYKDSRDIDWECYL